jgi:hypothetical protein
LPRPGRLNWTFVGERPATSWSVPLSFLYLSFVGLFELLRHDNGERGVEVATLTRVGATPGIAPSCARHATRLIDRLVRAIIAATILR